MSPSLPLANSLARGSEKWWPKVGLRVKGEAPFCCERGGSVSPHLVNRLDRETGGIVIVAKNSESAGELGKIWEARAVQKEYLAIVHGHVRDDHGLIDAPLGKDERSIVAVKDCVRPDGAPAQTEFRVERRFSQSLVGRSCRSAWTRSPSSVAEPLRRVDKRVPASCGFATFHPPSSSRRSKAKADAILVFVASSDPSHRPQTSNPHPPRPPRPSHRRDKLYGGDEDYIWRWSKTA